jgi:outer membrane protein OmpA-like peptidoglycan-associated protein
LFQAIKTSGGYRIYHFEEPVNSIYTDLDGYMSEQKDFILFSSDRPKGVGEYHKKGWMWNSTYWGNTDIYVAFSENGNWTNAVNLGNKVNTPFAERTPYLSSDGLRLYISSNGHKKGADDMDIYFFKRTDKSNWTSWEGPYNCKSLNSDGDDWGYKEYEDFSFFSRSENLKYEPTAKARNGTGFVFENNFRSGYDVNGAQSGSFKAKEQTDIYMVQKSDKPSFTLPDALFDVDQSEIRKRELASFTEKLLDLIKMNAPLKITIEGHTDNRGTDEHNLKLSLKRAETVKRIIVTSGYPEKNIIVNGLGSSRPVESNDTQEGRQKNRRVEVFF